MRIAHTLNSELITLIRSISDTGDTGMPRAIGAAEHARIRFDTVADDLAAAMLALRSQLVNRAFEAVEHVGLARHPHFEALVVIVAAHVTLRHGCSRVT